MELHPIAKCLLLQPSSSGFVIDNNNNSDEDNNINKFTLIPSSQSVRIEFHVEAILDLVIQLYSDKTNAEINPKLEEMEGVDLVTDINKNDNNTVLKSITHRLLDRTSSVEGNIYSYVYVDCSKTYHRIFPYLYECMYAFNCSFGICDFMMIITIHFNLVGQRSND